MNFNQEIIDLWRAHNVDLIKWYEEDKSILAPMLYPELKPNSLLTMGINPSFSETGFNLVNKTTPINDIWDYYSYNNLESKSMEWIEYEKKARREYIYYRGF